MRRSLILAIFTSFLGNAALQAQQANKQSILIEGVVLSVGPLPDANIALLHAGDSAVLAHTTADSSGRFSIRTGGRGKCFIVVTHVGYETRYTPEIDLDTVKDHLIHKIIQMSANGTPLKSVEVTRVPIVERFLDKVVVHVDNNIVSSGESVLELFRTIPGIVLDGSDNISIKGKSDIRVMIDGRETYQSGDQLKTLLTSMSANTVSKIEIISTPPAKYAAEGAGGLINIITKTRETTGLTGNVYSTYSQGTYGRTTSGASAALKTGNWVFTGSYDYSHGTGYFNGNEYRIFQNSTPATEFHQLFSNVTTATNQFYKAGVDWNFAPRQHLALNLDGALSKKENPYNATLSVYPEAQAIDSSYAIHNFITTRYSNLDLNADYSLMLDSAGQSLEANYGHIYFNTNATNSYYSLYFDAADQALRPPLIDTTFNTQDIHVDAYRLDYKRTLPGKIQLETGIKYTSTTTDNDIRFYTFQNNALTLDTGLSDRFVYTEDISAAYISATKNLKNVDIQLGARYENTDAKLGLTADSSIHRHLHDFFPTLYVEYRIGANGKLNFTSGRRISRPSYAQLNPFVFYYDPFSYEVGNPYLLPEYTYTNELAYTYRGESSLALGYSVATNVIDEITLQNDATNEVVYQYQNISSSKNLYAQLFVPWKMTSWWNATGDVNVTYTDISGNSSYGVFSNRRTGIDINYNNSFTVSKVYALQANVLYSGPQADGITVFGSRERLSLGARRSFFHKSLTASLRFSDVFFTDKTRETTTLLGENISLHQTRDTRRIALTLTYNFKKGVKVSERKTPFGGEDEKNRINIAPRGN
jgi:iron complex outermembrane receptor protein